VQAGGGIVADSDPATEDTETQNKAAAVVRAISVAENFAAVKPQASLIAARDRSG
jgi:anthranilate synthase component 1